MRTLDHMRAPVITIVCMLVVAVLVVGCKPALTKTTAEKLIPNGMSEAQVYELLGTNANITFGQHGEKHLLYFFLFTGAPPKVEAKIDTIQVVLSNGVVIERLFGSP